MLLLRITAGNRICAVVPSTGRSRRNPAGQRLHHRPRVDRPGFWSGGGRTTFVEQGLPGCLVEAWFAVIGPKGMGAAKVKRVHDAVEAAFNAAALRETMAKQGNTINTSSVA